MSGRRSSRMILLFPFVLCFCMMADAACAQGGLQIACTPALTPAFDPSVTDYVIGTGAGNSVQIAVNAPAGTSVSVDGQPFKTSNFAAVVDPLLAGQRFTFVVKTATGSNTYHVRRTPSDFPAWTTERPGTPQAEYYIFAPGIKTDFGAFKNYVVIADNYGVPIWWYRTSYLPIDAKLLPNGRLGWLTFAQAPGYGEERTFDGAVTRKINVAAQFGGNMDNHELLVLPNGNYIFIAGVPRGPVDLSAYGGSKTATVLDNVIEEITPAGALVWSWSSMDHLPIAETGAGWRQTYLVNSNPADPWHMNSVEIDMGCRLGAGPGGPGYVISLRHLDAVIRIDKVTGAITWKLGGTPTPWSLTMLGDPYGNLGGNHDARVHPDGTLSVHDNGTQAGRAPRAVRYKVNAFLKTATLVEQITDPNVAGSGCCGSARRLWGGNWVFDWGNNPAVTERDPAGSLVFRMNMADPFFSYRADAVPYGKVLRSELRNGMDKQYPR